MTHRRLARACPGRPVEEEADLPGTNPVGGGSFKL
jgi:hypothetical protein